MVRWSGARVAIMCAFLAAFFVVNTIVDAVGAPDWVGWAAVALLFLSYFVVIMWQGIRERDARLLSEGKIALAPARPKADKPD